MRGICSQCGRNLYWKASRGSSLKDQRCRDCGSELKAPRTDTYWLAGQRVTILPEGKGYGSFDFQSGVLDGISGQPTNPAWSASGIFGQGKSDYEAGYQSGQAKRRKILGEGSAAGAVDRRLADR